MKILPLAKIAAARKRLIERPKEMKMTKIDIEALWKQAIPVGWVVADPHHFARLIIEECAKVAETCPVEAYMSTSGAIQRDEQRRVTAAAIRALKP